MTEFDSHGHGDIGVVARTAYTTSHKTTWDRMVSGYLVTKAIAAGLTFRPLAETSDRRDVHVVSQPHQNLAPAARAFLAALIDAGLPGHLNRPAR